MMSRLSIVALLGLSSLAAAQTAPTSDDLTLERWRLWQFAVPACVYCELQLDEEEAACSGLTQPERSYCRQSAVDHWISCQVDMECIDEDSALILSALNNSGVPTEVIKAFKEAMN